MVSKISINLKTAFKNLSVFVFESVEEQERRQGSMEMANLFVNNLWITQRFIALPVDKSVSNLWISRFLLTKSIRCPVDNFFEISLKVKNMCLTVKNSVLMGKNTPLSGIFK